MGNDPPQKPIDQSQPVTYSPIDRQAEEDIYIVEDLQNISLKDRKKQVYFWVDPKIFNAENQKYENFLRKSIDVQGCSSVNGLENQIQQLQPHKKVKIICAASLEDEDYKRLQNNDRILAIYLFCQNKERAKLLGSNFSKIKGAKYEITSLRDHLLQEEDSDKGLDPKVNLLIMVEQDTNLMNKYRIVFHSLTSSISKTKAKSDFVAFAKKIYPDNLAQINQFESKYRLNISGKEAALQAIQWLNKSGFYWQSTQTLPKITTDPKKLAYLRFPFKQSYQGILKLYKSSPVPLAEVFMVITPTQQQIQKLKESADNFLFFTTFVKAYSNEKKAKDIFKKNPKSIFTRVMMRMPETFIQSLDFGYHVLDTKQQADVIFNIYNVFQIKQIEEEQREMTIQYGSLAEVAYIRQHCRTTKRLTQYQQNLLRNYDYLQDITSRINSQATILQMSGYFQDSLHIYNQKLQIIRKSQPSQQILDRHKIQLGDAYRINQQFKQAEEQFLSIKQGKMYLIAQVHLAELYFKTREIEKSSKVVAGIYRNLAQYKQISDPDSFKAQNYIGMDLMNRGMFKDASKLYKSLRKQISEYYQFKFEGIPLVHEIYRNVAACETKLNNFSEALGLLNSTKSWQKGCEGNKSPGLIITQNLIKSVHQSQGQSKQVSECDDEIKKIKKATTLQQNLYVSRSGVFINLDESQINIQMSGGDSNKKLDHIKLSPLPQVPQVQKEEPKQLLMESAINIDL